MYVGQLMRALSRSVSSTAVLCGRQFLLNVDLFEIQSALTGRQLVGVCIFAVCIQTAQGGRIRTGMCGREMPVGCVGEMISRILTAWEARRAYCCSPAASPVLSTERMSPAVRWGHSCQGKENSRNGLWNGLSYWHRERAWHWLCVHLRHKTIFPPVTKTWQVMFFSKDSWQSRWLPSRPYIYILEEVL